jgi:hypothetical protein
MSVLQGLVTLNGVLYAAFKGEPNDDRIFYSTWNGSGKWSSAGTIGGNTSAGPSLGLFDDVLYATWKGEWSDPQLYVSKYNGSAWESQIQIPNAYSDTGPALCQLGGTGTKRIAAWKNVFDQTLYYATYDGTHWSAPSQISGVGSSVGPSLANFGGKIYAAWKGAGSDQGLYYATYDGSSWSTQNSISGVASSVGPSLAGVGDKLYAVWKGASADETLYYAYYPYGPTKTWSAQTAIPASGSSMGVAIAEFKGNLYAMGKGKDSDVSLYNANFDGTHWSGWAKDIPGNTGPDTTTLLPVPTKGNTNYLLADSKGAPLTGTTVTIIVTEDIVPDNAGAYSFQINCNSAPQKSGAEPFVWQQYGFRIAHNEVFAWVNNFRQQDLPASPFINWDSRPPRMPNNAGTVPLPNNRLPKGWRLTTTLVTDSNSNVTGFSFSVSQPDGTVLNSPELTLLSLNPSAVSANLAPILNYQIIMVAENIPDDGPTDSINFSAGQGLFLCYETNNLTASVSKDESAEESNVKYSSLPASYPNGEFYQLFGIGLS